MLLFLGIVYKINQEHKIPSIDSIPLTSHQPLTLKSFYGKYTLIYFGFLSCPEVCPTTLKKLAEVEKKIGGDQINIVFMTLDPERDTIDKMQKYAQFFHPKIIPVRIENIDQQNAFTRFFGIQYRKIKLGESKLEYTIDHTTDIILLSPKGKIMDNLHHDSPSSVYVSTLQKYLKETSQLPKENL